MPGPARPRPAAPRPRCSPGAGCGTSARCCPAAGTGPRHRAPAARSGERGRGVPRRGDRHRDRDRGTRGVPISTPAPCGVGLSRGAGLGGGTGGHWGARGGTVGQQGPSRGGPIHHAPPVPPQQRCRSPELDPRPLRGLVLLVAQRHGPARHVQLDRHRLQVPGCGVGAGAAARGVPRGLGPAPGSPVTVPVPPGPASPSSRSSTRCCG